MDKINSSFREWTRSVLQVESVSFEQATFTARLWAVPHRPLATVAVEVIPPELREVLAPGALFIVAVLFNDRAAGPWHIEEVELATRLSDGSLVPELFRVVAQCANRHLTDYAVKVNDSNSAPDACPVCGALRVELMGPARERRVLFS